MSKDFRINNGAAEFTYQASTPGNPPSNHVKLYAKNDDKIYILSPSGVETDISASAGDLWSDPVDSNIIPDTTNTYNIGEDTTPYRFKDGFFGGDLKFWSGTSYGAAFTNHIEMNGGAGAGGYTAPRTVLTQMSYVANLHTSAAEGNPTLYMSGIHSSVEQFGQFAFVPNTHNFYMQFNTGLKFQFYDTGLLRIAAAGNIAFISETGTIGSYSPLERPASIYVKTDLEVGCGPSTNETGTIRLGSDISNNHITIVGDNNGNITLTPHSSGNVVIGVNNLHVDAGQMWSDIQSTLTPTGTTETVDWDDGNFAVVDFASTTGNVTFTFSNPNAGAEYYLKIIQDTTTHRTVTWPGNVKWPGGTAPTITAGDAAIDLIKFVYDGTNYLGTFAQNFN